jgi:signal transduction histidine kinase/CheY-like chemotaxis protein
VKRLPLSAKLAVGSALVVILVVGGAFLGLSFEIRSITKRFFADELRRNQSALLNVQHRSQEQLLWTSSVLTENPTLRAAIETYREESASGRGGRTALLETIEGEVEGLVAGLNKDLLVVTDGRGHVLAARERHGAAPASGTDLSKVAEVRRALDPSEPSDSSGFGIAHFGPAYFQVAYVPILLRGFPIGVLILGDRIDAGYVEQLRRAVGGEVVVASRDTVIAATVPVSARAIAAVDTRSGRAATVRLEAAEYVVARLPLGVDPAGAPVALHLLHPLTPALTQLNRALLFGFLLFAVAAVVLVAIGSAVMGRSLLQPLSRFVEHMSGAATGEEAAPRFDPSGAPVEVLTLSTTYDRLMVSLDQKRLQLEQRSAELARANVDLQGEMHERARVERALRESEAQLRQSQKLEAVGTLAGGIAHDFNNLLTVIISYTDLVLLQAAVDVATREDLKQVREAADRAATLTKQLLAFSRRQVLQPKVIDLSLIVDGIRTLLRRVIGEDIELRAVSTPPLARVKADPGQVEQVLMNLAVNARDAMPSGGQLTIETADEELPSGDPRLRDMMTPGKWVRVSVRDTGIGMSPQVQERIFEPFFTTKEPGKGTGLGLATVYGIVKQSGGFVWVSSAVGVGTTFDIYLPPVEGTLTPAAAAPVEVRTGTETVLLVEDEAPVRALAQRCLERYGYRVLSASGLPTALDLAARHAGTIDLLLTDVVMPQGSGRELAERLRPLRPEMRVLYMSGYTDDAVVRRAGVAAGSELLEKPFTPEVLALRVRQVLDRTQESHRAVSITP